MRKIKKLLAKGMLWTMLALMGTACSENKVHPELEENYNIVEREVITEDLLTVTSSLPAYVSAYNYTGFGKALVDRLGNRVASVTVSMVVSFGFRSISQFRIQCKL